MAKGPRTSIYIEPDLLEKFDAWCKKRKVRRSTVIKFLIQALLDGQLDLGIIVKKKGEEKEKKDEG